MTAKAQRQLMTAVKAVIFDCDGVMFDTAKANTAYYNQVLRHFGKPDLTPAQFEYIQMHTVGESIAFLLEDEKIVAAAMAYRDRMTYEPFYPLMEIEPDLIPLLKRIRPQWITAIATNRSDTIGPVLEVHQLAEYFDLVVSALDVPNPKPHPDPLLKVTDHFGLQPHQAIYIGDSKLDEQASQSAAMPFVAYQNKELNAAIHIDRLNDLLPFLDLA